MEISSDATYLNVGTASIQKANILFFDHDEENVYVILSGRKTSHYNDGNNITIPFAEAEIEGEEPFASAAALQAHLITM
jgi:hypothetical protein